MPKFAANLSTMFAEHPFIDRFEAAARAGFEAVECQQPYAAAVKDIAARLSDNGLGLVLHNTPEGGPGGRGIACHPGRGQEFRDSILLALDYASALGCPYLHCMAGVAPANAEPEAVRATYIENLAFAAEAAAPAGVTPLVEPINTRDVPGYFMTRTDQALEAITATGGGNLGLQFDLYHRQIVEGDLIPTLERVLPHIRHIQIADTPGRHEPGTGEINYPFVLERLDALGYAGCVGCEYWPRAGTLDGLGWILPWLPAAA
jgi:hydroxypyruvate isomerase